MIPRSTELFSVSRGACRVEKLGLIGDFSLLLSRFAGDLWTDVSPWPTQLRDVNQRLGMLMGGEHIFCLHRIL